MPWRLRRIFPSNSRLRRAIRRNRALLIALIVVGALVALLNGIGAATHGNWISSPVFLTTPMGHRFGAATAFDKTRDEILIFGGFSGTQPPAVPGFVTPNPATYNDTWGGYGVNRNPNHRPSPRGFASMAYDDARKKMVLFGGAPYRSNAVFGETWTWDGVDWTLQDPPEPRPPARQNASMAYDAHRKLVMMFGGRDAEGKALGDTWTWNGSVWKKVNAVGPSPRYSAAMEYDLCRAEAVLFGGVGPPPAGQNFTSAPGETWTWNGTNWAKEEPKLVAEAATPLPGQPPPRMGASMVYSNVTGRILLYGGLTTTDTGHSTVATDENLWMWDGTGWEREVYTDVALTVLINTFPFGFPPFNNTSPPPRAYTSFGFDPVHGSALLFSGTPADPPGVPQVALPDFWGFGESNLTTGIAEGIARQAAGMGGPRHCSNPVPIPSDGAGGDQVEVEKPQLRKVENREEIREIGRLPLLLGTDPKTVPKGAPKPDCLRRDNEDGGSYGHGRTHLATDSRRNRIYQFFVCTGGPPIHPVMIQAYDGTTLKPLATAIAPISVPGLAEIPGLAENLLQDFDHGRFLYRYDRELSVIDQDLIEKGANPLKQTIVLPPGPHNTANVSLFSHPKTGRAKLLISYQAGTRFDSSKTPPASQVPATIAQWDVDGNREDWRRVVDACGSNTLTKGMRVEDRVYATCITAGSGQTAQTSVVKIPITEAADGSETAGTPETFPGPFVVNRTWSDPKAERMLLMSDTQYGSLMWTFDGKASRYVGRTGLTTAQIYGSVGFDEQAGRLYMLVPDHRGGTTGAVATQGGLLTLDTRLTPTPQTTNFGQFSYPAGPAISTLPAQDGLPRRVFVRRPGGPMTRWYDGQYITLPNEPYYLVLADLLPVPEQPEISKLDALTIPVAEKAGKTEVSFDSEGSGYGIRLRSVGGISSALRPPPQSGDLKSNWEFAEQQWTQGLGINPACYYPDRELVAGWVPQARLSDLEASARSSGLEVDSSSKSDLEGPVTRCLPPAVSPTGALVPPTVRTVLNVLWPLVPLTQLDAAVGGQLQWSKHFKDVECVGDALATNQATVGNIYGSANCVQKQGLVEATARGSAPGVGPASSAAASSPANFSAGEGYSNVVITRDSEKGVVVTSTAVARGINVGPLSIDRVESKAVAWSNGRPSDTERATFTRTICGVHTPDYSVARCLTAAEQKQLVDNWNARWGVNSKMTLPAPDPNFFNGSPGGYIAGVIKPLAGEIEDQMLARDLQKEVPGLEITFYKDSISLGPGRQVVQLAGTRALAGFGVQCQSHLVYSPTAKDCVALDEEVFAESEFVEEFSSGDTEDTELNSGGWVPLATDVPEEPSLGARIGRLLESLPAIRRLPIREIGEAILAGSVWWLLGLPLFLASRRFALSLARMS